MAMPIFCASQSTGALGIKPTPGSQRPTGRPSVEARCPGKCRHPRHERNAPGQRPTGTHGYQSYFSFLPVKRLTSFRISLLARLGRVSSSDPDSRRKVSWRKFLSRRRTSFAFTGFRGFSLDIMTSLAHGPTSSLSGLQTRYFATPRQESGSPMRRDRGAPHRRGRHRGRLSVFGDIAYRQYPSVVACGALQRHAALAGYLPDPS